MTRTKPASFATSDIVAAMSGPCAGLIGRIVAIDKSANRAKVQFSDSQLWNVRLVTIRHATPAEIASYNKHPTVIDIFYDDNDDKIAAFLGEVLEETRAARKKFPDAPMYSVFEMYHDLFVRAEYGTPYEREKVLELCCVLARYVTKV